MVETINAAALAALADERLDWRFKGLPASWWGRTAGQICAATPNLVREDTLGPVCVLRAEALSHNLVTMADWCSDRGVELAPHGKTHMAPQLLARQFESGASAVTVATISQARVYRAFGVSDFIVANELVDAAALRWVAAEMDRDPDFTLMCWVDSVRRGGADGVRPRGREPTRRCLCGDRPCRGPDRLPRRSCGRRGGTCGRGLPGPAARRRRGLRGGARPRHLGGGTRARHRVPVAAAVGRRTVGRFVRDRQRRRDGRRQHILRRGRRCAGHRFGRGAARAHHRPQRLLSHPRPRAVRADVTPSRRTAAGARSVGAGDVATRARSGAADDGPPRRVVRPGHAGAAGPFGQSRHQAQRSTRIPDARPGRADRRRGGQLAAVRDLASVHHVRQVADDPGTG